MDNTLVVFVKNPKLGKAKTRIAKDVGDHEALKIYSQLLQITRDIIAPVRVTKAIYYSEYIDTNDLWASIPCRKELQNGGDLGAKMMHAFNSEFDKSSKVVLIGSDCPYITQDIIDQAFLILENKDMVLGPVEDGGFYLIGLRRMDSDLFKNVVWSTSDVLDKTIKNALSLNMTYSLLEELSDVDFIEDWQKYQSYRSRT